MAEEFTVISFVRLIGVRFVRGKRGGQGLADSMSEDTLEWNHHAGL